MFNPFAPEPAVTVRADPCSFYRLWRHQFWLSRITSSANLCRVKRYFKPYQNEPIQSRTPEKKAKNHVTLTLKFPRESCSTTHLPFLSSNPKILNMLKAFLKTFRTKMKPSKCPAREKKWGKKRKKGGRRESEMLLSAHARTSQANILHLGQKTAKCTTCKLLCGSL